MLLSITINACAFIIRDLYTQINRYNVKCNLLSKKSNTIQEQNWFIKSRKLDSWSVFFHYQSKSKNSRRICFLWAHKHGVLQRSIMSYKNCQQWHPLIMFVNTFNVIFHFSQHHDFATIVLCIALYTTLVYLVRRNHAHVLLIFMDGLVIYFIHNDAPKHVGSLS